MEGEVVDQGDSIHLIRKLGGVRIAKSKIQRIEYDKPKVAEKGKVPDDIVVQTGGRTVHGRAKFSPDGNQVWVTINVKSRPDKDGKFTIKEQRVSIPRDHVREILWKGKRKKEGETRAELAGQIRKHVEELRSKNIDVRNSARAALLKLGVFSIPLMKKIAEETGEKDPIHPVLQAIIREHNLKSVVSSAAESQIKTIYKRLASKNHEIRMQVISEIVLKTPKSAPKVLVHFLTFDAHPEVRAVCISQLSMLRCFNELAGVLKLPNGRLRLAAALALGEHGILAGVPVLIDALAIYDIAYQKIIADEKVTPKAKEAAQKQLVQLAQLRELANRKLVEFTGQDYGFKIYEAIPDQKVAVKKWRNWWLRDGPRLLRRSVKMVGGFKGDTKERQEAVRYWIRGGQLQTEFEAIKGEDGLNLSGKERRVKFLGVADFYKRSIQIDPTFVPARLALSYVYYNELEKYAEAKTQLKSVLNQTMDVKSKLPRRTAYLYLSNIARRVGDFKEAELRLYDALKLVHQDRDSDFDMRLDLHLALGDMYMDWALIRQSRPRNVSELEAGQPKVKDGKKDPKKVDPKIAKERKEKNMKDVSSRLRNAKLAYERGLEEINRQDQSLRESAQKLIDSKSNDMRKAALLQSLRATVKQLGLRAGAFYYGVGRASAALGFSRSAEQNFSMASRMNVKNERFKKAAKYWRELIRSRDSDLRSKLAKEKRDAAMEKRP
jgi:hypothetical protein